MTFRRRERGRRNGPQLGHTIGVTAFVSSIIGDSAHDRAVRHAQFIHGCNETFQRAVEARRESCLRTDRMTNLGDCDTAGEYCV